MISPWLKYFAMNTPHETWSARPFLCGATELARRQRRRARYGPADSVRLRLHRGIKTAQPYEAAVTLASLLMWA
ncbi:hypothetical protein GCM10017674_23200 [Streptomyces gardneri]|uniref:Uncharacterized protein n=1 Tax=Streptomyces gardneri TaxID=66892 RepID=A0A4Y3RXH3_9ACTN|nr:hypothetical protein SGA01_73930 [Streptomyces gardneri]GHG93465.1 hypothetical protein GCM10017674_23200 [Streptomyces gardneri]